MPALLNTAKAVARELTPPPVLRAWRRLRQGLHAEWTYEPAGMGHRRLRDQGVGCGWRGPRGARSMAQHFCRSWKPRHPLGTSHEHPGMEQADLTHHNAVMCFAYAFGRAALGKECVRFLDWGGGLGHYYQIAQSLFPDVQIEYTCRDLPGMVRAGRDLQPTLRFVDTEREALDRSYDLILSSSSLQYSRDWGRVVGALAKATRGYLLITRLPTVLRAPSFVARQRAYAYGYDTEYLGWCLNCGELIDAVTNSGLALTRRFCIGHHPFVYDAPEQFECRGFLFRAP